MNDPWYIVKQNWPATVSRHATFAGVGGDTWPLDKFTDQQSKSVHAEMMASRQHLQIGPYEEFLCVESFIANRYWIEADKRQNGAWLLELSIATPNLGADAGIDIGFSSGGFSVVESELITQSLPGPRLNEWGLIGAFSDAATYLIDRNSTKGVEQIDGISLIAIKVLRRGN
jgi:hypothetical protein